MIKWYKQIDETAIKTFLDSIIELKINERYN